MGRGGKRGGGEKEGLAIALISYHCGGLQTVQLWILSQSNPFCHFLKVANRYQSTT